MTALNEYTERLQGYRTAQYLYMHDPQGVRSRFNQRSKRSTPGKRPGDNLMALFSWLYFAVGLLSAGSAIWGSFTPFDAEVLSSMLNCTPAVAGIVHALVVATALIGGLYLLLRAFTT